MAAHKCSNTHKIYAAEYKNGDLIDPNHMPNPHYTISLFNITKSSLLPMNFFSLINNDQHGRQTITKDLELGHQHGHVTRKEMTSSGGKIY